MITRTASSETHFASVSSFACQEEGLEFECQLRHNILFRILTRIVKRIHWTSTLSTPVDIFSSIKLLERPYQTQFKNDKRG
ncbi:hypothetical protein M8J76_002407 [Diaphorina citri]|nr:hypothetical protein M8J76_002407 [Diaphorina citri]